MMSIETYSYDTSDNITSVTDRKGQTTFLTYDTMNRISRIDYADGSYTAYAYDAVGRLTTVSDSISGSLSYTYTDTGCGTGTCGGIAMDKVASETTPLGSINYAYDVVGRRASMIVTGQPAVNYGYDSGGRLNDISTLINGDTKHFSITYDGIGRRSTLVLPNGVSTNYSYDSGSRLLTLQHVDSASAVLESFSYEYDSNGNRTSMTNQSLPTLLPISVTGATYNDANQMLSFTPQAGSTQNLTYDLNRNMTSITNFCGTTNYTWDARNRLVAVNGYNSDCSALTATFQYDALGRRIEKTVNGTSFQYVYDGLDIIQVKQGSVVAINYIRSLNIDEPFARIQSDGSVRYYLKDAIGSVIALTDENGAIKTQYSYGPFGSAATAGDTSDNAFQYTGRENDGSGLFYYRARYYNPELQRFISEDPIRFDGGVNFFAYVGNNPINFIDPKGLEIFVVGRGPFVFRPWARINRVPRTIPQEAQRMCRETPPRNTPTPELGPPTPNPATTSPWAEFWQNVADLLDELSSGPPTTPYDPLYGDLGA